MCGSSPVAGPDRRALVSRPHPATSRATAASSPTRSSSIVDDPMSRPVASGSDWAVKRRRPLSTSDAVTEAVTTARNPIPVEHHDGGDEPTAGLLRRDVAIPHRGDRLQREPKTPADRRILLMVEQPLQDPARNRDHHRNTPNDPRRPARSQRVTEQQARRQRNLLQRLSTDECSTTSAWRFSASLTSAVPASSDRMIHTRGRHPSLAGCRSRLHRWLHLTGGPGQRDGQDCAVSGCEGKPQRAIKRLDMLVFSALRRRGSVPGQTLDRRLRCARPAFHGCGASRA